MYAQEQDETSLQLLEYHHRRFVGAELSPSRWRLCPAWLDYMHSTLYSLTELTASDLRSKEVN